MLPLLKPQPDRAPVRHAVRRLDRHPDPLRAAAILLRIQLDRLLRGKLQCLIVDLDDDALKLRRIASDPSCLQFKFAGDRIIPRLLREPHQLIASCKM